MLFPKFLLEAPRCWGKLKKGTIIIFVNIFVTNISENLSLCSCFTTQILPPPNTFWMRPPDVPPACSAFLRSTSASTKSGWRRWPGEADAIGEKLLSHSKVGRSSRRNNLRLPSKWENKRKVMNYDRTSSWSKIIGGG